MKKFLFFVIFIFLIISCHKRLPVKDYTLNDPRLIKRYPRYFTATSFVRYRHTVYKKVTARKANYFARFSIPEDYDELKEFYAFDKMTRGKIRKDLMGKGEETPIEEEKNLNEKESKSEPALDKKLEKIEEPEKQIEKLSANKNEKLEEPEKSVKSKSDKKLQEKDSQEKKLVPVTQKQMEKDSEIQENKKLESVKESEKDEIAKKQVEREVKHTVDFEMPKGYINLTQIGLPDYYRTFLSDKNERVVEVLYIEKDLMFQFIDRKLAYVGEVSDLELTLLEKGYPQNLFIRQDKEGNHIVTLIYKSRFGTMERIYTICDGVREYYQEVP